MLSVVGLAKRFGMKIVVNDKMQQGYEYELTAKMGAMSEGFEPELNPKQMLEMGVFEGKYLNDCREEFPDDWFVNARISERADVDMNYFKVKSRLSLQEWQRRGWIVEPDPRGWFQWYCRYYMGRRIAGVDEHQIKRWRAFRRHRGQIVKNCMSFDFSCRKRQRQALLQWAYDPFV